MSQRDSIEEVPTYKAIQVTFRWPLYMTTGQFVPFIAGLMLGLLCLIFNISPLAKALIFFLLPIISGVIGHLIIDKKMIDKLSDEKIPDEIINDL